MCREISSSWSPPLFQRAAAFRWSASDAFASSARWASWSAFADRVPHVRCLKPYIGSGRMAFPCGDCPSCRANRRRIWTHRMMLEAFQHEHSAFITLTYKDVPDGASLSPRDLQLWLKRFREVVSPVKVRYFAVGEYGDRTQRPHYHVALFGFQSCVGGRRINGECQCPQCLSVRETWGLGHVMLGDLTVQSAQYITGYVAKKMTRPDDRRLEGRYPEFARMSRMPGIGAGAVPDVASVMMQYKLEDKCDDVPVALRHGASELPLGRYLRRLLRQQVGLDEGAPQSVLDALRSGLLPMYEAVEVAFPSAKGDVKRFLVQSEAWKANEQYGRNVAARQKKRVKL